MSWSADGTRLLTIGDDGVANVWDTNTGESLVTFDQHTAPLLHAQWSPDQTRIATASEDGTARVWDANTGEELFVFGDRVPPIIMQQVEGIEIAVWGVSWSPDGSQLVAVGADGLALIWDTQSGELLKTLRIASADSPIGATVFDAFWSPDGQTIALQSFEESPTVWDATTGEQLYMLQGHEDIVPRVIWSSDGTQLTTAGVDGTIRLWDAAYKGDLLRTIDTRATLWSAQYSPDGTLLATTSENGTIRLWDLLSGYELQFIFPPASEGVMQVTYVVTGGFAEIEATLMLMALTMISADTIYPADVGSNTGIVNGDTASYWTYRGVSGEMLILELTSLDENLRLSVLKSDQTVIGETEEGDLTVTLPANGEYFIEIVYVGAVQQTTPINYELILVSLSTTPTPAP